MQSCLLLSSLVSVTWGRRDESLYLLICLPFLSFYKSSRLSAMGLDVNKETLGLLGLQLEEKKRRVRNLPPVQNKLEVDIVGRTK